MSNIEWTEKTWNPVIGCKPVSPGCANCYAATMARRIVAMGGPAAERYRLTVKHDASGAPVAKWSGVFVEVPSSLDLPLRTRKPTTWFVDSMSDLFGEGVSDEYIAAVFGVMASTPQHTFQVLTKRAERMAAWFARNVDHATECGEAAARATGDSFASYSFGAGGAWPLPNVWLGVSIEDQQRADERIPHLLRVPAAVRFLSVEPLLGPVDLDDLIERDGKGEILGPGEHHFGALTCDVDPRDDPWDGATVDWVIVGGESGPGARPCDLAWIRSVVEQCKAAGVACFVKQLGADPIMEPGPVSWPTSDPKGGDPAEWPVDLRVREFPAGH